MHLFYSYILQNNKQTQEKISKMRINLVNNMCNYGLYFMIHTCTYYTCNTQNITIHTQCQLMTSRSLHAKLSTYPTYSHATLTMSTTPNSHSLSKGSHVTTPFSPTLTPLPRYSAKLTTKSPLCAILDTYLPYLSQSLKSWRVFCCFLSVRFK